MKIEVYLTIGYSTAMQREVIDIEKDWNINNNEWKDMDQSGKDLIISDWAENYIEYGYKELEP